MSVDFLIKLSTRGAGHTLGLSSAQPSAKTRTSKSRFLKTSYIPRTSLLTASPVVTLGVRIAILVMSELNRLGRGYGPPFHSVQIAKRSQEFRFDAAGRKVILVTAPARDSQLHIQCFILNQQVDRFSHEFRI